MIQRIALTTALMAALVALPVVAQPAKARATANVDLDARFKEAQTSPQLADDLYKVGSRRSRGGSRVRRRSHGGPG